MTGWLAISLRDYRRSGRNGGLNKVGRPMRETGNQAQRVQIAQQLAQVDA
jgi:hypothetical protein